ncbi:Nudix family hydrolase [Dokdonella sp.]|uniref:Nudix family hydrolase n=1 Tax=Dokdonella sp. TaxID=2291710 RepID=UPI0027B9F67E|nr:Nudix family hydrolase [Dokdonella sp.]
MPSATPLAVVAGVILDAQGRVLLAQRPPGRHLAGAWEFPGGKSEPGEVPVDALARELREELGIVIESARPLIRVPHDYGDKRIVLDVWRVSAWSGRPEAREGQRLAWALLADLDRVSMPAADRPAVLALRLPSRFLITPEFEQGRSDALLADIERACTRGVGMIALDQPGWPRSALAAVARHAHAICQANGVQLLLADDAQLAAILGLDGVYLSPSVAASCACRPLPEGFRIGVACHDATQLDHATSLGADFATLGPIYAPADAPMADAMGWEGFEARISAATLPVYACGNLESDDLDTAQMAGAQGIAASHGLW